MVISSAAVAVARAFEEGRVDRALLQDFIDMRRSLYK
jgi:hypothetical protein